MSTPSPSSLTSLRRPSTFRTQQPLWRRLSSLPAAATLRPTLRAGYDQSVATYRQTMLTTFQQVEDSLAVLRILQHEAAQQEEAIASAREALEQVSDRYREGADPYLQDLTVQAVVLANERKELDILRRRVDASVLLMKALGGGWNATSVPKNSDLH
jgi:outer membrane protein TolC